MNIIVLAAGKGQRFKDAGWQEPKPFIPIYGREDTVIDHVLSNIGFRHEHKHVLFSEECRRYDSVKRFPSNVHRHFITSSRLASKGSAIALINFNELCVDIETEEEVLVINCDQLVENGSVERALDCFRKLDAEGGVVVALDTIKNRLSSHVDFKENGEISTFHEKSCGNNPYAQLRFMDVGIIYWKSGKAMIVDLIDMVNKGERTNGEYCHGPALNRLINRGSKVLPYFTNEFHNLGTPEGRIDFINKDK